jgi:hypothetical protein
MAIDITLQVRLSVEESALEDALAEFDELTVTSLVTQVLDKAIALEHIDVEVKAGPNSLEEYDKVREARTAELRKGAARPAQVLVQRRRGPLNAGAARGTRW